MHGKTVEGAGLRHLGDFFLISVQRGNVLYSAVGGDFVLLAGDVLSFTGSTSEGKKIQPSVRAH